jgi:RNA polymerase sigma-70 factor (ECF subfamily)
MSAAERAIAADVKASLNGDGAAFARIIDRYQPTIGRRMTKFTRDPNALEELVHDVFVEAYTSLRNYRGEAPLEHWLQRIATRVGYRYWKQKSSVRIVSLDDQPHVGAVQSNTAAGSDAADDVGTILEQLAPRDRLVLTLLYLESRSVAEAAELAGWSQTMVKVQAYRARQRFKKLYGAGQVIETA